MPYGGGGIYDCYNDGDIAVTFDDGPYEYTDALLDLLAVGHHSTLLDTHGANDINIKADTNPPLF